MRLSNPFARALQVPAGVVAAATLDRGDKVLAGAPTRSGSWLLGTRLALVVVPAGGAGAADVLRLPWESVERADWDRERERLVVSEVGEFGRVRPQHAFEIEDPGVLVELVRERVTASVLLQRRVSLGGGRGLVVVARRSPQGDSDIIWAYQLDPGVSPDDPHVREAADAALVAAADELGL
jgi:hypothetical protein